MDSIKDIKYLNNNSKGLHPLTCNWFDLTQDTEEIKNVTLTKYDYVDNQFLISKPNTDISHKLDETLYHKYLYTPPVGISSDVLLKIYNIIYIDDIITYLIQDYNPLTILRLLDSWIINNPKYKIHHKDKIITLLLDIMNKLPDDVLLNIIKKKKIFNIRID